MIQIVRKEDCCGCEACRQVCPKQCIRMKADNEGFRYPQVDTALCIDCHLCEKVCPVINQTESREPIAVYAARNKDEKIRIESSSGGIFTLLAEKILSEGGVVFGVKFNQNWDVVHDYTETVDGLAEFRGSKYVQSAIGDTYLKVKEFLGCGRKVLFSGTPCQIAGLKTFLRKEYENLLTVEVVCHGVPSPMIWRDYLEKRRAERTAGKNMVSASLNAEPVITGISFRDKTNGWKKFGFKISYAASKAAENSVSKSAYTPNSELTPFHKNIFMKGFLSNLYLRPSCYECAARSGKSGADISIADYWGIQAIHPEIDDDKGTGAVLVNTVQGQRYYESFAKQIQQIKSAYANIVKYNPCIVRSVRVPRLRNAFWRDYQTIKIDAIEPICRKMRPSPIILLGKRIIRKIINTLKK